VAPKLDERIAGVEEKLKQLKTRQQRLEARKRALASRRDRKHDTRRKILIGAVVSPRSNRGYSRSRCCSAGSMRRSRAPMTGSYLSCRSGVDDRGLCGLTRLHESLR
jgi:hypothetical protein